MLDRKPSAAQLDDHFEEVDARLAAEGVGLLGREIRALGEVSKILGVSLRIVTPRSSSIGPKWDTDFISLALYDWYNKRYGEKLKSDFSIGSAAITIRGDIWEMRIPSVYGQAHLYCDSNSHPSPRFSVNRKPVRLNILDCLSGITGELRAALSRNELEQIFFVFVLAYTAYYAISPFKADPLVSSCLADHQAAVNYLMTRETHPGQSRWASLQAGEKALKMFISAQGSMYPRSHDLTRIALQATALGLVRMSDDIIDAISCTADVRYGHAPTNASEALLAHHASLILTGIVGNALKN